LKWQPNAYHTDMPVPQPWIGLIHFTTKVITFSAFGPREANAQGAGPSVYVDTTLNRTAPLIAPILVTAVTAIGQAKTLYVKIARAPHLSNEPPLSTDKTFAWGFTLTYDTSMFKVNVIGTDITEEPATVTTTAQFLKRRMYSFDPDGSTFGYIGWGVSGFYTTSFASGESPPGTLTLGDTYIGTSDPTTIPLPADYFDATNGPYAPDHGRQLGSNYDYAYTENSTQAVLQPDGVTTVTDPTYCLLAIIKLTSVAVPTGSYGGSAFHLSNIILIQQDGSTNYFGPSGGTTMDAYYVKVPAAPEFPLGLGVVMMIAPAIVAAYLWRKRPKKVD